MALVQVGKSGLHILSVKLHVVFGSLFYMNVCENRQVLKIVVTCGYGRSGMTYGYGSGLDEVFVIYIAFCSST